MLLSSFLVQVSASRSFQSYITKVERIPDLETNDHILNILHQLTPGPPSFALHRAPGFYILQHRFSPRFYVGSASSLYNRYMKHKGTLTAPEFATNQILAICLQENGYNFDMSLLPTVSRGAALDIEQFFLNVYFHTGLLLNDAYDARSPRGAVRSVETRGLMQNAKASVIKRVSINNVIYNGYNEAGRSLGIDPNLVRYRVLHHSPAWTEWKLEG